MNTKNSLFSPKARAEMDHNIAKYPPEQKQSAVMACLIAAQKEHGWVSPAIIAEVADILEMPTIAVEEVATFYNMYETKPIGQFKLVICTNLPCQLSHGEEAAQYLQKKLGISFNDTTPQFGRGRRKCARANCRASSKFEQ